MHVTTLAWSLLIVLVIGLLVFDFVGHVRHAHTPSLKEATIWSVAYISLAVCFGFVIYGVWGIEYAAQYWAGWVTEWSLSIDNLFVFLIIFSSFRVPRQYQQKVLLIGITLALIFRGIFIILGSAIISRFSAIFYLFGFFLIYTAITQLKPHKDNEDEEYKETTLTRIVCKIFPTTPGYVEGKMLHRNAGKTYITPMLIVVIAVGSADIMFAFDSIPAIFGLTKEPYIVFAANAFSLLGLRQFFFLIDRLMEKLVFLNYGLAAILGFIGIKLIIHAMHENNLSFINGGEGVHWISEPSIAFSMIYILSVLIITAVTSVIYAKRKEKRLESNK
ncbi:TerC/Alx family metal homeostasis membrane protein [Actinomyces sp. zg-332]|uniref:TerC/Alx family metal homeostasis membrane protein n=1 Tax=Actinomyces sp. zg-332 TaxID=2708340 RepID=UPI001424A502|nr:TerC/Alx family metal homeostasis membrane protein [Actinomyces sp. zg-332]QPK94623.1 TerC/Alx family metal homeostasis membrane protein [Actinomyces sp. zg-332]